MGAKAMTEITTTLKELLEAAYEAASVDATVQDKARLGKALTAFEVSEAIPCNLCKSIDCDRTFDDEGNPSCVPVEDDQSVFGHIDE